MAAALSERGFASGDRGAIFAYNSPDWYAVDYAIQVLGGVSVPIYMNLTADQAAYVLSDSGSRIVYVDTEARRDAVLSELEGLPDLGTVITLKGLDGPEGAGARRCTSLEDLLAEGVALGPDRSAEVATSVSEIDPDALVTLSYTSGTTGVPKGVELSHTNIISTVEQVTRVLEQRWAPDDRVVSYLPLAHIAQRMMDQTAFYHGAALHFPDDILSAIPCLSTVRPTLFVAVPRVLESPTAPPSATAAARRPAAGSRSAPASCAKTSDRW